MTSFVVYKSDDGRYFTKEKDCKRYEELKAENPDEPGVRFYNDFGDEIPMDMIRAAKYLVITHLELAKLILNSGRLLSCASNFYGTENGVYRFSINHWKKLPGSHIDIATKEEINEN